LEYESEAGDPSHQIVIPAPSLSLEQRSSRGSRCQGTPVTNLNFFSNDQLTQRLANTTANPDQLDEALRIGADARTRALKIGFLVLSGHKVGTIEMICSARKWDFGVLD
jgi:hypothetical protein